MQADTSLWNIGLVGEKQSDWGPVSHEGLSAEGQAKIRRGVLYDHASASWVSHLRPQQPPPPKVFPQHDSYAIPATRNLSEDAQPSSSASSTQGGSLGDAVDPDAVGRARGRLGLGHGADIQTSPSSIIPTQLAAAALSSPSAGSTGGGCSADRQTAGAVGNVGSRAIATGQKRGIDAAEGPPNTSDQPAKRARVAKVTLKKLESIRIPVARTGIDSIGMLFKIALALMI
jgi:hypothetical protein